MNYAIILAAGNSTRIKNKTKKQFLDINNKIVVYYSIDKFLSLKKINKIILVLNENDKNTNSVKLLIKKYSKEIYSERLNVILGGKERFDSVYAALDFIDYSYSINSKDKVLIHDAARPNFNIKDADKLLNLLNKYKSITLGSIISDTIKEVRKTKNQGLYKVIKTYDRNNTLLISTPQAFNLKTLYNSYDKFIDNKSNSKITDDVQIIEKFGKTKSYIYIVSNSNMKITTKKDIKILEYLIKNKI